ncbi:MAG: hypothetical protein PVH30_01155 [Desulfobacterales bacterium]|jgi:hypothetical protein
MKKFIYLIQSADRMPYPELPGPDCDVLLLTWDQPADHEGSVFLPGSSWCEGRNRLLREALERRDASGMDYLYYIFLDDDCEVVEDVSLARRLNIPLTGNPFRTFEAFLIDWEPAIGYTRYDWQHVEPDKPVNLGYNFDALFNAYHRESISFLLPYYTGFDAESWLYSQHIINHLAAILYNPYRLQYNVIRTVNQRRKGYRQRKKYWQIPTTFLRTAIKSTLADAMRTDRPNAPEPIPGVPRRKDRSYRLDRSFIQTHFRSDHPLIRHRSLPPPPAPQVRRKRMPQKTAVCMAGRCRGLERTIDNLVHNLLTPIGDYDLFLHTPEDEYSHLAALLKPDSLLVEEDQPLEEGRLAHGINCLLKTGVQAYLQQLHGLKRCNGLRLAHEAATGTRYDWVIRCRPDLMFESPIPDLSRLDPGTVHVPDFHQFEGVNDRFAVGNPKNMTIYMSKCDDFHSYVEEWINSSPNAPLVTAEMFTAGQLRCYGVRTRLIPIRFNRVRDHTIKQDTGRR